MINYILSNEIYVHVDVYSHICMYACMQIYVKTCFSKVEFDRISFAVQAPPVSRLFHTVEYFASKRAYMCKNMCISKVDFDRISIAVQAPPVFRLFHTVEYFAYK